MKYVLSLHSVKHVCPCVSCLLQGVAEERGIPDSGFWTQLPGSGTLNGMHWSIWW